MLSGKAAKHLSFAQRFFGAKNAPQNDSREPTALTLVEAKNKLAQKPVLFFNSGE